MDITSASEVDRCILHFKGIDILINAYNLAFGMIAVPFVKLIVITLLIFSLFASVRLFRQISCISFVFISLVAVINTPVLVLSTMVMSYFFDISSKFPESLSPQLLQITETKARRINDANLKSCRAIRCKVGSLYHMEAKATLVTLHHVINGLVFLLVNVKT